MLWLKIIVIGVAATLCMDIWNVFLKRAFGIRSLDYCLLGRWVLHIPSGRLVHANIGDSARKDGECAAGWAAHYTIGVAFALALVFIAPAHWLAQPTLLPALAFGIATVAVPFFTLQPALGLGVASSKTRRPAAARLKSLATHSVFGTGLYLAAELVSRAFSGK